MLTLFEASRAAIPTGMKTTPTSMKIVITCAIVKKCHLPSDFKLWLKIWENSETSFFFCTPPNAPMSLEIPSQCTWSTYWKRGKMYIPILESIEACKQAILAVWKLRLHENHRTRIRQVFSRVLEIQAIWNGKQQNTPIFWIFTALPFWLSRMAGILL